MEQGGNMSKYNDKKRSNSLENNLLDIKGKLEEMDSSIKFLYDKIENTPLFKDKEYKNEQIFENLKKASEALNNSLNKDSNQLRLFPDFEEGNNADTKFDEKSKEILLKIDQEIKKMSNKISDKK